MNTRTRSRARAWALQALYAWEMRGRETLDPPEVLDELCERLRVSPANRPLAEVLVRVVHTRLAEIDRLLDEALTNWRLERLSVIDRNLLRLGAAELLFLDEAPERVTIAEMVRLAAKYGTPESPRFVGGVLEGMARRARAEEAVLGR
ncbi:MAG: transcription antitermination factor NusB [Longimicrobiaceae bacterium]